MVALREIRSFAGKVAERFHPERVILFGSYAYGTPTADSDVDLLVVMPHDGPPALQAAEIRQAVRAGFPMDLIVRSPATIRRRLKMGDAFIEDVVSRGRTLYEAGHAGMG